MNTPHGAFGLKEIDRAAAAVDGAKKIDRAADATRHPYACLPAATVPASYVTVSAASPRIRRLRRPDSPDFAKILADTAPTYTNLVFFRASSWLYAPLEPWFDKSRSQATWNWWSRSGRNHDVR